MNNRRGEVATLLTLGLVIIGGLITLGSSFFVNKVKTTASNPKALEAAHICNNENECGSNGAYDCKVELGCNYEKCSYKGKGYEFGCWVQNSKEFYGCIGSPCDKVNISGTKLVPETGPFDSVQTCKGGSYNIPITNCENYCGEGNCQECKINGVSKYECKITANPPPNLGSCVKPRTYKNFLNCKNDPESLDDALCTQCMYMGSIKHEYDGPGPTQAPLATETPIPVVSEGTQAVPPPITNNPNIGATSVVFRGKIDAYVANAKYFFKYKKQSSKSYNKTAQTLITNGNYSNFTTNIAVKNFTPEIGYVYIACIIVNNTESCGESINFKIDKREGGGGENLGVHNCPDGVAFQECIFGDTNNNAIRGPATCGGNTELRIIGCKVPPSGTCESIGTTKEKCEGAVQSYPTCTWDENKCISSEAPAPNDTKTPTPTPTLSASGGCNDFTCTNNSLLMYSFKCANPNFGGCGGTWNFYPKSGCGGTFTVTGSIEYMNQTANNHCLNSERNIEIDINLIATKPIPVDPKEPMGNFQICNIGGDTSNPCPITKSFDLTKVGVNGYPIKDIMKGKGVVSWYLTFEPAGVELFNTTLSGQLYENNGEISGDVELN